MLRVYFVAEPFSLATTGFCCGKDSRQRYCELCKYRHSLRPSRERSLIGGILDVPREYLTGGYKYMYIALCTKEADRPRYFL